MIVDPTTFARQDDDEELLLEEEELLALLDSTFGLIGWNPWVPNPPPLTTRLSQSAFINRAPVRLDRQETQQAGIFDDLTGGSKAPQKQDPRLTAATEKLSALVNALLRRGDIMRLVNADFRLSWLIPQLTGVAAPNLTIFYNTTTGLVSYKDENGVVIPIGTGAGGGITQLTGDVTAGPGSGSQAATIANDAVTYAKMQNVSATDRLLGRSTAGAGDVEEIVCTAAGRALIDDADAATQRTTLGLASGVYTPTLTNVANLAASTAFQCQYLQVGSVVTVSGKVAVDPTLAATATELGISLPVASNFGAAEDCGGVAFATGIAGQGAGIIGDAANDRASMNWVAGDISNQNMSFCFSYRIL